MHAWTSPPVPTLPGTGPQLRLYDTATKEIKVAGAGAQAGIYVCGITPYDATHLGHAATYLAFDLVQRAWLDAGKDVRYVQNVTDVDDPLIERAAQTGETWDGLATREIQLFREDMAALRVLAPDHYVGAVEAIPEIVTAVRELLDQGHAYRVDDDVYYSVAADEGFGSESGYDRDTMLKLFAERGGDPERVGKKDPLDSLLWRAERPGEPAWPSILGAGRPGWHIECSMIAVNRLSMGFDVQGGGSDLIFPHHEHSASHAIALTGHRPFAHSYVHTGMIGLDGEKMSKSRGNLVFVSKLRGGGVDPMAIRLALLDGHYRSDREWTGGRLPAAERRLTAWRAAMTAPSAADAAPLLEAVRTALANDLDTSAAIQAVDDWAAASGEDTSAPGLARDTVDALLGIEV
jgi:L-cysteine:1D-myo-inositol 2-amino-2-deoxy-alpha-D-glucopyranoside ligase